MSQLRCREFSVTGNEEPHLGKAVDNNKDAGTAFGEQ
jgi:hypothetical protein